MPSDDVQLGDCYHDGGGQRQFDRSSIPGLLKSLNHCHLVNKRLIEANTHLAGKIAKLERADTVKTVMLWIAGTANAALFGVILAVGPDLVKCVLQH